jgi:hypothetical protein
VLFLFERASLFAARNVSRDDIRGIGNSEDETYFFSRVWKFILRMSVYDKSVVTRLNHSM